MAANVPMVKQVAWISLVPQLLVIGLLVYGLYLAGSTEYFLHGALVYLLLSYILRASIPKSHRQGIRLVKQQKFADAIPRFERSLTFFARHPWVDNYRFLTMLSSSKLSYREMGLCNIAFCHTQLGNGFVAKQHYERILSEYPANGLAQAGLNVLNSMSPATSS